MKIAVITEKRSDFLNFAENQNESFDNFVHVKDHLDTIGMSFKYSVLLPDANNMGNIEETIKKVMLRTRK